MEHKELSLRYHNGRVYSKVMGMLHEYTYKNIPVNIGFASGIWSVVIGMDFDNIGQAKSLLWATKNAIIMYETRHERRLEKELRNEM